MTEEEKDVTDEDWFKEYQRNVDGSKSKVSDLWKDQESKAIEDAGWNPDAIDLYYGFGDNAGDEEPDDEDALAYDRMRDEESKATELSEFKCPNCGSYKTQKEGKSSTFGAQKKYVCLNCFNLFEPDYSPQQIRGFNESKAKEWVDPEIRDQTDDHWGGYYEKPPEPTDLNLIQKPAGFRAHDYAGSDDWSWWVEDQVDMAADDIIEDLNKDRQFEDQESKAGEYSAQQTAYAHDRMRELNEKAREMYGKSWRALTMEERDQVNNEIEGGVGSSNWIASGGSHDSDLAWFPVFESKATEIGDVAPPYQKFDSLGKDEVRCPTCFGRGEMELGSLLDNYADSSDSLTWYECKRCNGTGKIDAATEGGLGSGRRGHKGWMKEITELKTNKHKIPQEHMSASKFLKEMASENSMCADCMDNFLAEAIQKDEPEQHKQVEEEAEVKCPRCGGTGRINLGLVADFSCDECGGSGMIAPELATVWQNDFGANAMIRQLNGESKATEGARDCDMCDGLGTYTSADGNSFRCQGCKGTGKVWDGYDDDPRVPYTNPSTDYGDTDYDKLLGSGHYVAPEADNFPQKPEQSQDEWNQDLVDIRQELGATEEVTFGMEDPYALDDLWATTNEEQRRRMLNSVGYGHDNTLSGDIDKYRNEREDAILKDEVPHILNTFDRDEKSVRRLKGQAQSGGWSGDWNGESKATEIREDNIEEWWNNASGKERLDVLAMAGQPYGDAGTTWDQVDSKDAIVSLLADNYNMGSYPKPETRAIQNVGDFDPTGDNYDFKFSESKAIEQLKEENHMCNDCMKNALESLGTEWGELDFDEDANPDDYIAGDYLSDAHYAMDESAMYDYFVGVLQEYAGQSADSYGFTEAQNQLMGWRPGQGFVQIPGSKANSPEGQRAFSQAQTYVSSWLRGKEQEAGATYPTPTWESKANEDAFKCHICGFKTSDDDKFQYHMEDHDEGSALVDDFMKYEM